MSKLWKHRESEEKGPTTRAGRAVRNNKYRKVVDDVKQRKQLFTPEIKKLLKEWLLRRRRHPYPSRGEKRELAMKTGLTYIQICNWFANWRRKLRKSTTEGDSWGRRITGYNSQAPGNCEHFSISSADSVWDEACSPHSESNPQVSRTEGLSPEEPGWAEPPSSDPPRTSALLKWLESAARFRPREVSWSSTLHCWGGSLTPRRPRRPRGRLRRHREEMDAAEALTFLSSAASRAQL